MLRSLKSPITDSTQVICGYANTTNHLQIIRIENIPDWYFERVIFPGQRLFFEAQPEAELEVYTHHFDEVVLVRVIPCYTIQVQH